MKSAIASAERYLEPLAVCQSEVEAGNVDLPCKLVADRLSFAVGVDARIVPTEGRSYMTRSQFREAVTAALGGHAAGVDERQQEGERLAGSGARLASDVLALQ